MGAASSMLKIVFSMINHNDSYYNLSNPQKEIIVNVLSYILSTKQMRRAQSFLRRIVEAIRSFLATDFFPII
jgi:hypothetical protein